MQINQCEFFPYFPYADFNSDHNLPKKTYDKPLDMQITNI